MRNRAGGEASVRGPSTVSVLCDRRAAGSSGRTREQGFEDVCVFRGCPLEVANLGELAPSDEGCICARTLAARATRLHAAFQRVCVGRSPRQSMTLCRSAWQRSALSGIATS